jgi:hypothetical protein
MQDRRRTSRSWGGRKARMEDNRILSSRTRSWKRSEEEGQEKEEVCARDEGVGLTGVL